jgi:cellulose synthase (UDP-forming)
MGFYLVPTLISTILFPKRKIKFKVTPKGLTQKESGLDLKSMRPILIFLGLNLIAAGISIFRAQKVDFFIGAEVINFLWVQFIVMVLAISVIAGIDVVEEREGIRVKCSEFCKVSLLDGSETSFFSRLVNISESGVAFQKPETFSLEIGQTIEFSIHGEPIQLTAEVKRISKNELGCAFLNVTPEQQRQLIEFVFCRSNRWEKPRIANEVQALKALFRTLFDLYPLQKLR